MDALSEKIREAITMHYFEGLSVAQIAERLSLPEGTVKWRLCEGRKQLRKEYGVMEKTYNENESLVQRVMRQVEQLKLLAMKNKKNFWGALAFMKNYRFLCLNVAPHNIIKKKNGRIWNRPPFPTAMVFPSPRFI